LITGECEFHRLAMAVLGAESWEGRQAHDGSPYVYFNRIGVSAKFFAPSQTNPNGRIDFEGTTTWAGTPQRMRLLFQPKIEGAKFVWQVIEARFGWSGSRRAWTSWERAVKEGQGALEVFTKLQIFAAEAEQQSWL